MWKKFKVQFMQFCYNIITIRFIPYDLLGLSITNRCKTMKNCIYRHIWAKCSAIIIKQLEILMRLSICCLLWPIGTYLITLQKAIASKIHERYVLWYILMDSYTGQLYFTVIPSHFVNVFMFSTISALFRRPLPSHGVASRLTFWGKHKIYTKFPFKLYFDISKLASIKML